MPLNSPDFLAIGLDSITADSVCKFDLYQEMADSLRLFRRSNVSIAQKDLDNLKTKGQETLYVPASQKGKLQEFMIRRLPYLLRDESVSVETKLESLTEISVGVLDQVLTDPRSEAAIRGTVDQCRNHVALAVQGDQTQRVMTSSRPTTTFPIAHAINVGNLAILLGLRCGIEDGDLLHGLGVGALLHEIGKRIIDPNYYFRADNKTHVSNSRLKRYPVIGTDMLKSVEVVPRSALFPILEHQERLDGSGFPHELRASQISKAGRIVAICDHYDETLHSSDGFMVKPTPFQVLMKMREDTGKFDRRILVEFIHLLGSGLALEKTQV
ncbi:MAG: hypothetical protein KOO62_04995 [candidate division Zixibacteria bacterium]|nr:hypothetical protein [candidate division Zixibacteria bacterium]